MPETGKPVDASRGTAIWGLNRLRSDLLPALLADLAKRETEGIDTHQCMRMTKTLGQLADSAAALSADESAWKTALQADLSAFREIFIAHNMDRENTEDAIKNRVVTLAQLHTVRQKLSNRIRRNLSTFEGEVHIRAVESMFASFRDLSAEFPDSLPQVGAAVARFFAGLIAKTELHHPGR